MTELSTRDKLKMIGKETFLEKGFKDASLREIAKRAGFTLGAFYGYYESKEALFDDIVSAPAQELYEQFVDTQARFAKLPADVQMRDMNAVSGGGMARMIDIIYDDFDAFKLVFFRSAGTAYEGYMQKLIDVEVLHTFRFLKLLNESGHDVHVDDELVHMLASALFSGMMEIVDHDMNREKATGYIMQLYRFHSTGWQELLAL